jgi:hypothetical protein
MNKMNGNLDLIRTILEKMESNELELLTKELKVPPTEILHFLKQFISNINKQVGPEIFVMPFSGSGSQYLLDFASKYNTKILVKWM